jgi:hypothetical protein
MDQSFCARIRLQANQTIVILRYTRVRERMHINACIESHSLLIILRSFCGLSEPQRGIRLARVPYQSIQATTVPHLFN